MLRWLCKQIMGDRIQFSYGRQNFLGGGKHTIGKKIDTMSPPLPPPPPKKKPFTNTYQQSDHHPWYFYLQFTKSKIRFLKNLCNRQIILCLFSSVYGAHFSFRPIWFCLSVPFRTPKRTYSSWAIPKGIWSWFCQHFTCCFWFEFLLLFLEQKHSDDKETETAQSNFLWLWNCGMGCF